MEISNSGIGKKVCETKSGVKDSDRSSAPAYGLYAEETDNAAKTSGKTALCGGVGYTQTPAQTGIREHAEAPQVLKDFVEKTLLGNGSKNWPTSSGTGTPKPETNDNAKAVAKDLVQELTPEEKTIVAGLLAKTIEGGEVVEIRAVSSTSVMVSLRFNYLKI